MILCVTLNPCLDKTLVVPPWRPGDSVRGTAITEVVGGKGNNVARALKRLGRDARPVTFLGGPTGRQCEDLLRNRDGLEPLVTATAAPTRTILTVRTEGRPDQSAFFDPDPEITAAEADDLHHRIQGALASEAVEMLILSGSSPAAATHHLFSDLIALGRSRRIPVLLDTYGPALGAIWGFWPEVLKLNRREAAAHLNKPGATDDDLLNMLADWRRHGVRIGMVTDGPGCVLVQLEDGAFRCSPPEVSVVNPIGSGDCLLAGIADGLLADLSPADCVRRGIACASANTVVWEAGAVDPAAVRETEESGRIQLQPIERENGSAAAPALVRKVDGRRR